MSDREQKRFFQWIKSLSFKKFQETMDAMHSRAYWIAEKHYQEAMDIELQPKQKARVLERVKVIREVWDGMATVTTDKTIAEVFTPREESTQHDRATGV